MIDGDGSQGQGVQPFRDGLFLFGGGGRRAGFADFFEAELGQLLSSYHQNNISLKWKQGITRKDG